MQQQQRGIRSILEAGAMLQQQQCKIRSILEAGAMLQQQQLGIRIILEAAAMLQQQQRGTSSILEAPTAAACRSAISACGQRVVIQTLLIADYQRNFSVRSAVL